MGTRGRDLIILVILSIPLICMIALSQGMNIKPLFLAQVLLALSVAWFHLYTTRQAKKQSRKMGLGVVVLLPLYYPWAKLLIRLAGADIKVIKSVKCYEVHIVDAPKDVKRFLALLNKDLELMKRTLDGLFLWETPAPVPSNFRKMIKEHQKLGLAFWRIGRWPIPKLPFGNRELNRGVPRIGALIHERSR